MKRIFLLMSVLLAAGITTGFLIFTSIQSFAAPSPVITWIPTLVSENVSPLEEKSINVSFTSSANLSNIAVIITPKLRPYIESEPSIFPSISAGITTTLRLKVMAAANAPLGIVNGVIRLVSTVKSNATYAQPLHIKLQIGKKFTYEDFSFLYPSFGVPSEELIRTDGGNIIIDVKLLAASGEEFVSQFGLILHENMGYLNLIDWFLQNVDLTGTLISSGSFTLQSLPNGISVLVHTGSIPAEHLAQYGPIADFYGISP